MERLTIDEIIEHCERKTKLYEEIGKSINFETIELKGAIREYWEHKQVKEYLEELKQYRDAEKQGLLLRLPCKVGDTVYIILASYFDIGTYNIKYAKADVRDFAHFTSCGFCVVATSKVFGRLTIPFSDFGKTVFLTKTEAEQKLKEMENK